MANFPRIFLHPFRVCLLLLCAGLAQAADWQVGTLRTEPPVSELSDGSVNFPRIEIQRNCEGDPCVYYMINHAGEVLRRYPDGYRPRIIAQEQYADGAFVRYRIQVPHIVRDGYSTNISSRQQQWMIDDQGFGQRIEFAHAQEVAGQIWMIRDQSALIVNNSGVQIDNLQGTGTPALKFPNNTSQYNVRRLPGDRFVFAVIADDVLWGCTIEQCFDSGVRIPPQSNTNNHFAIFSPEPDRLMLAVYYYENRYSRGLYGAEIDLQTGSSQHGWVLVDRTKNMGFNPYLFSVDDQLVIRATNTTEHKPFYLTHPLAEWGDALNPDFQLPERLIINRPYGISASTGFLAFDATSRGGWRQPEGGDTAARLRLDFGQLSMQRWNMSARIGVFGIDLDVATPLRNQNHDPANWLRLGLFFVDNDPSTQENLTIRFEYSDLQQFARVEATLLNEDISLPSVQVSNKQFSAWLDSDGGSRVGVAFARQVAPGIVAYSNYQDEIVLTKFDEQLKIQSMRMHFGYDHLAKLRRYETRLAHPYIIADLGLGISWLPDAKQYKDALKAEFTVKSTNIGPAFNVASHAEMGVIFERPIEALRGLGWSIQSGVMVNSAFSVQGPSSDDKLFAYDEDWETEASVRNNYHRRIRNNYFNWGVFASMGLVF